MMARIIRKMQVPAYAPEEVGVQAEEKRGAFWVLVKTAFICMDVEVALLGTLPMLPIELME